MARASLIFAAFVTIVAGSPAYAQNDPWTTLVTQALNAASSHDYASSERIFEQALQTAQRFGADDPRVGTTLNSMGLVYRAENKFADAESAFRRALAILQKSYGKDSLDLANVNFNIATALFGEGQQQQAAPFLQKTLGTYETVLGSSSLKTAAVLCMLGDAHRVAKEYAAAEASLRRCADIRESVGGVENSELADALYSLALTLMVEGKFTQADPRFTLAERIREKTLGITSPVLAQTFEDHAIVLRQLGKDKEAERLTGMAAAIRHSAPASERAPAKK